MVVLARGLPVRQVFHALHKQVGAVGCCGEQGEEGEAGGGEGRGVGWARGEGGKAGARWWWCWAVAVLVRQALHEQVGATVCLGGRGHKGGVEEDKAVLLGCDSPVRQALRALHG